MPRIFFKNQILLCAQVSGARLLSLRPTGSDSASKSTSCQQPRPRSSRRSNRRRRRTPLLRTPGNQGTGGGGGDSSRWESGLKSRPPRSLMPSQPTRGRRDTSHWRDRKKILKYILLFICDVKSMLDRSIGLLSNVNVLTVHF